MSQFLIVEDEKNLGQTLRDYFLNQGHEVYWASDCQSARTLFKENQIEVVLMDLGLPDGEGLVLAQEFRNISKSFVLFFLSAQGDPETRLEGLELGAEDFVTKPFQLKELLLRLNRALKFKSESALPEFYHFGDLKFYPHRHELHGPKNEITSLSFKEAQLLILLIKNMGKAITRDQMFHEVWGEESYPSERTIDNFILKYRKWLELSAQPSIEINTIRGVGHCLNKRQV